MFRPSNTGNLAIPNGFEQRVPILRVLLSAKLGRCPRCMRSSLLDTLLSWAGFGLVRLVWPVPWLLIVALVVVGSCTVLLAAYLSVALKRTATVHGTPAPRARDLNAGGDD